MSIYCRRFPEMLMTRPSQRSPRHEQLELFVEKAKRPTWGSLPREARQRISALISQMLLEHLQGIDSQHDRKEVVHER